MLLAEIFRLMVRLGELRGSGGGVSAYGHWDLLREGCLGWKSFFAGLCLGIADCLGLLVGWRRWGVWCFDWKLVRELEDFGGFSSLEQQTWHGFTHKASRQGYQGVSIRGLSSFIIFWTSFGGIFGKTGGWKGNLIVLEKQQTSYTHNICSSLFCSDLYF
jgi:hypothetical protein